MPRQDDMNWKVVGSRVGAGKNSFSLKFLLTLTCMIFLLCYLKIKHVMDVLCIICVMWKGGSCSRNSKVIFNFKKSKRSFSNSTEVPTKEATLLINWRRKLFVKNCPLWKESKINVLRHIVLKFLFFESAQTSFFENYCSKIRRMWSLLDIFFKYYWPNSKKYWSNSKNYSPKSANIHRIIWIINQEGWIFFKREY